MEYGAIEIQLSHLPDAAKEVVIAVEKPLMESKRSKNSLCLRASWFFKIIPDESIVEAFALKTLWNYLEEVTASKLCQGVRLL